MNEKELSDKTDKKPTNPMARSTSFKKGNRANPNGRPKGSVNEVTKFKRAVALFEKEEDKDIYKIILEKAKRYPQVLIAIFKALVPQQTESNVKVEYRNEYENLSDQELIDKANEILNRPGTLGNNRDTKRA